MSDKYDIRFTRHAVWAVVSEPGDGFEYEDVVVFAIRPTWNVNEVTFTDPRLPEADRQYLVGQIVNTTYMDVLLYGGEA